MGLNGFEPLTSPLSGVRSNQLSYRPTSGARTPKRLVLSRTSARRSDKRGTNRKNCKGTTK